MKIIDIAICVNNIDPKGIGRIRCIRYNDYVSEKERSLQYEDWDDTDPFVAIPFLPSNINLIPEVGQAVKIINYNTEKETVNQEYIAGPFTTMFDFNSQTFSQQIENTTYGVAVKRRGAIRRNDGDYIEKNSEYVFAKENHYGIYGRYGSDIIFTENGLEFRGGKLIAKDNANARQKRKLITQPIFSDKIAKLHLKKFDKKARLTQENQKIKILQNAYVKTVVEYEIDDLETPTKIDFFVYNVIDTNEQYRTDSFNDSTPLYVTEKDSPFKLINLDDTLDGPTHTINIVPDENNDLVKIISVEIRDFIYTLHQKSLNEINSDYSSEDLHPFYFRSSLKFKTYTGTTESLEFRNDIFNKIKIRTVGPSNGLIWSKNSAQQKLLEREVKNDVYVIDEDSKEQTFASLTSDKIYLLSTDTNETSKKINFDSLDKYEYTQQNLIKDIEPNTYSLVRGEELVEVLKIMRDLFESHIHNISTPLIQSDPNFIRLQEKINNLENNILNKSIRIN